MADITAIRINIPLPGAQYRAAVSESLIQNLGSSINFINDFQHNTRDWYINGPYNVVTPPQTFVDGMQFMLFNSTILDAYMFVEFAGSGGTTELDVLRATTPGGSFTSIFTTKPAILSTAGNAIWIHVGSSVANTTAPVLDSSQTAVNAGDAFRLDLTQSQTGDTVAGAGLVLFFRPR